MTLREAITAPDGFRLVRGPFGECRRDPLRPRQWRGLSAADTALLVAWLADRDVGLLELYTDVTCGVSVELDGSVEPEWLACMAAECSALRIDVVVREGGEWFVIEVKPSAGYTAMGQVLTYGFYAPLRAEALAGATLGVITDALQEVCRPVYAVYGVQVFEVGGVGL